MSEDLPRELRSRYDELKTIYGSRDNRHAQVAEARSGNIQAVLPGVFPDSWPKPIVANVLENTAKELANVLAMLPGIDCLPARAGSDSAKKNAAVRTKIALNYVERSRLRKQMQVGADWYFTFAAMPIVVEPNVYDKVPCMRIDDPRGAYWITDAYGRVELYAKEWSESVVSLCAKFPDLKSRIVAKHERTKVFGRRKIGESSPGDRLTVVRMYTADAIYMWLPDRADLILETAPNYLGRVPVEIAELPRWDGGESRGAFDQVLWVWLAHNRMALLGMEAAKKAIQAPIVAGDDVQKIPIGPDAVLRAREPEKIRRLSLEMPQSHFLESQMLQVELQQGLNRQASASNFDASIVTGRGVEALNGVFSTAIKSAQDDIGDCLRRALSMCFEMDEKLWPDLQRTAEGVSNGAPFTDSYTPSKDIKGNYTVSVTYGFIAGLDPSRGLVYLLQLRGDRAIDRATMLRSLPQEIDVESLGRDIDLERLDDAALSGVEGLAANLPMLAQSGQMDIAPGLAALEKIYRAREKGTPISKALGDAFAPPEQAPMSPEEQALAALQAGGAAPGAAGPSDAAGPPGGTGAGPGGEVEAPGPDTLNMLLAGLTGGGNANLQANVSRYIPG